MSLPDAVPIHVSQFIDRLTAQSAELRFGGSYLPWVPVADFRSLGDLPALYAIGLRSTSMRSLHSQRGVKNMSQHEYEKRGWIQGSSIGDGQQGPAFLARRNESPEEAWPFVLKRLRQQNQQKARRRMHFEVAILETLDHPGVVELVESNANDFKSNADLYMVTHRVHGIDLDELVRGSGPLTINEAAEIMDATLDIVAYCHSNGIVHRDIKPCHVILANGDRSKPRIIDFGLSFNQELDGQTAATSSADAVGNRFMGLPEHQSSSDDKRDKRSDVTQCVGLLFFLLTAQTPGYILDRDRLKPHERIDLIKSIAELSTDKLTRLRRIFDVGFQYDPRHRWQSAVALQNEIRILAGQTDSELDFDTRLDALQARVFKSPAAIEASQFNLILQGLKRWSNQIGRSLHQKLAPTVRVLPSLSHRQSSKSESELIIIGFTILRGSSEEQVRVYHTCHFALGDLVVRRNESLTNRGFFNADSDSIEVFRTGLFDPNCVNLVSRFVENVLFDRIRDIYQV